MRMTKADNSGNWKAMIWLLVLSFAGAFLGAAWVAYAAVGMGAAEPVWVPLSAAGAALGCVLIFVLWQPDHLFKGLR